MGLARPDAVSYRRQLKTVRDQLARAAEKVAIKGDDLAQFVWAENRGRSVEVYWDEQGICVAFWDRGADSESHQSLYPAYEEAALAAAAWPAS
jgi:hypothetical protein